MGLAGKTYRVPSFLERKNNGSSLVSSDRWKLWSAQQPTAKLRKKNPRAASYRDGSAGSPIKLYSVALSKSVLSISPRLATGKLYITRISYDEGFSYARSHQRRFSSCENGVRSACIEKRDPQLLVKKIDLGVKRILMVLSSCRESVF